MRTYHVTYTRHVPRILMLGLLLRQRPNWCSRGTGKPMGGGAIFAFEDETDAIRWAAKMDWAQPSGPRPSRITILTLDTPALLWDTDFADPLSQVGKAGRWLKTFQPITPDAIVAHQRLTAKMIRRAVQEFNAAFAKEAAEGATQ